MKLLLDEGLPVQLLEPLRRNHEHTFAHVEELGWKGKLDHFLFADAAKEGFDAIIAHSTSISFRIARSGKLSENRSSITSGSSRDAR